MGAAGTPSPGSESRTPQPFLGVGQPLALSTHPIVSPNLRSTNSEMASQVACLSALNRQSIASKLPSQVACLPVWDHIPTIPSYKSAEWTPNHTYPEQATLNTARKTNPTAADLISATTGACRPNQGRADGSADDSARLRPSGASPMWRGLSYVSIVVLFRLG
jgi:hypothetical protein